MREYPHDQNPFFHERNRAVFELPCRIRFRMDITDLFHLQTAFQAHCKIDPAPDKENIFRGGKFRRKPLYALLIRKHSLHFFWQSKQFFYKLRVFFLVDCVFRASERKRQRISRHKLRGIRFRRCYGNFRTSQGVKHVIGFPRDRRADHVDDRKRFYAPFFRFAKGGKTIRRFPRLTDHDYERILFQNGVSIPKFRSELHPHGYARKIFDHVLRHHPRVIRRPTRHDRNFFNLFERFVR